MRGWFRQNDFPQNRLLYGRLGRSGYIHWLHRMGVRYVVLTTAPTDYSARGEARLIRGGTSGLSTRSAHPDNLDLRRAVSPVPIVTGPAPVRMLALRTSSIAFVVTRPGIYHVAIRYTPYWTGRHACIQQTRDGMFDATVDHPGRVRLRFALTPTVALATIAGAGHTCDPA